MINLRQKLRDGYESLKSGASNILRDSARGYQVGFNQLNQRLNPPEVQQRRSNFVNSFTPVVETSKSFFKSLPTQTGIKPLGTGLGGAASAVATQNIFDQSQNQSFNTSDQYLKMAIDANKRGDKQSAQKYFDLSKNVLNLARSENDQRMTALGQGKKDTIVGGTRLALTTAAVTGSPTTLATSMGVGGGLGGLQAKLENKSVSQGVGEGMAAGIPAAGLNRITTPVFDKTAQYVGGKAGQLSTILANGKKVKVRDLAMASKIGRFLGTATAQGAGNLAENEFYTRMAEGRTPTGNERVSSFALGALVSGLQNGDILFEKGVFRNKAGQLFDPVSGKFTKATQEIKARQKKYILSVIEPNDQNMLGGMRLEPAAKSRLKVNPEAGFVDPSGFFKEPYQRGDLKTLQIKLDELLGTKSFNNTGKWQADLPARQTAKRQIEEFAQAGDVDAQQYLKQVNDLENEIANATLSKDQAIKSKIQIGVQPTKGVKTGFDINKQLQQEKMAWAEKNDFEYKQLETQLYQLINNPQQNRSEIEQVLTRQMEILDNSPLKIKDGRIIVGRGKYATKKVDPVRAFFGDQAVIERVPNLPTKGVETERLFRGGLPLDTNKVTDRGISFSRDKSIAQEYSSGVSNPKMFEGGEDLRGAKGIVEEMLLDPKARVVQATKAPSELLNYFRKQSSIKGIEKIAEWAKKEGFDAVDYKSLGVDEVRVFNPKAINSPTKGVEPTPTGRIQNQVPVKNTFTFYGNKKSQQILTTPEGKQLTVKTIPSKAKTPEAQQALKEGEQVLQQKVNGLDYFRTPEKVLQKIGLGDQAKEIRTAYSAYTKELPQEIDKITSWFNRVGKSADASKRIFQYLDGKPIQLQGEELKVAGEIKGYLKNWASRLGLPEDKQVTNYITHLFDDQLIKKEFDPELEKLIADKIPGSVYDPFLQKRYGVAGYKEDAFQALDAYVKRATRKVHMDGALSSLEKASDSLPLQSWQYVKNYTDRINLRPTEIDNLVDTAIKQSPIGYRLGQRPTANVTRNLRTAVYRGTLGLNIGSAIRNLTQGANTYAELGEKWTAKGYFDATRSLLSGSKELDDVGVTGGAFVQDRALSATKKFGEKLDKVLFGAFELAERINRGAAYYGAKAKALNQGKSLEEAIQAGIDTARKTQFTFGSVDTPVGLQSDLVKTFTQLQSYNVKQAEFLLDKVQQKEFAGLIRYIAAWTLFAYAGNEVLGLDWKSAVPFSGTLEGKSPVGSTPPFQLASGVVRAGVQGKDKYGSDLEGNAIQRIAGDQDVQNALGAMTIPGFVQGKKTLEGISTFNKGYSETKKGRVRFPVEQTTGNRIKTTLFGQYSTPEARQYFDQKRSVLGKKQGEQFKSLPQAERVGFYSNVMDNRVKNADLEKIKEEVKNSGKAQTINNKYVYYDDKSGKVDSISLNFEVQKPQLTGEKELDKKLISKYKTELSNKGNDIVKLYELGQMSKEEASQALKYYESLKVSYTNKKGKKIKGTISFKQVVDSYIKALKTPAVSKKKKTTFGDYLQKRRKSFKLKKYGTIK